MVEGDLHSHILFLISLYPQPPPPTSDEDDAPGLVAGGGAAAEGVPGFDLTSTQLTSGVAELDNLLAKDDEALLSLSKEDVTLLKVSRSTTAQRSTTAPRASVCLDLDGILRTPHSLFPRDATPGFMLTCAQ